MNLRTVATLTAAIVGPVVWFAPKSRNDRPRSIDDLVALLRASNKTGWDLVAKAQSLVNASYSTYSAWHLWRGPQASLRAGEGMSIQYNQVLGQVLTQLGFEVATVQSARVRRAEARPWWLASHVWLRVRIGDHVRDVCAGNPSNSPGVMDVTPVAEVRPFRPISRWGLCTLGVVPVTVTVWTSWLTGDERPSWLYRPFNKTS